MKARRCLQSCDTQDCRNSEVRRRCACAREVRPRRLAVRARLPHAERHRPSDSTEGSGTVFSSVCSSGSSSVRRTPQRFSEVRPYDVARDLIDPGRESSQLRVECPEVRVCSQERLLRNRPLRCVADARADKFAIPRLYRSTSSAKSSRSPSRMRRTRASSLCDSMAIPLFSSSSSAECYSRPILFVTEGPAPVAWDWRRLWR